MVAGSRGRIPDAGKDRASRDQAPSRVSPGTGIRLESGREAPREGWPGRRVLAPGVCSQSQPWQHACRAFPGNQPPPERSEFYSLRRHRHLDDGRGNTPRPSRGRGLGAAGTALVERGGAWAGAEAGAATGVSGAGQGGVGRGGASASTALPLRSPTPSARVALQQRLLDHPNSACPCGLDLVFHTQFSV